MPQQLSSLPLVQAFLLFIATWLLYKLIAPLVIRSPLHNIPGPPAQSFVKGNLDKVFDRHGWAFQREISEKYGAVVRLTGLFGTPRLFVYDPTALHSVVVKEQDIYEETPMFLIGNGLVFGKGLLTTLGHQHRKQRKLLNPIFSINHMRHMLPIFNKVAENLKEGITIKVHSGVREQDMLEWMSRTALELIGQGGLGHSFDPLVKEVDNTYGHALKALMPALFSLAILRRLLPYVVNIGSPAFRRRVLELIPNKRIQRVRELVDIMDQTTRQIWENKKAAFAKGDEAVLQQVGEGKDIVSKLLQANEDVGEEDKLPDEELLAQLATLTSAAVDTTSSALARILHLLAENQDVQEKLRREIVDAHKDGNELSYDELVELPYLEAVCRETLRLYSPASWVTRKTRQDTIMPLSKPLRGVDGTLIHEIPVPKGTEVVVGIRAANRNPDLWGPDSDEWKPERWLSPLPDTVTNAHVPGVYSNLMTFLGGSRACIGFKFSQMEMKVVLVTLLQSFKFTLSDKPIVWNLSGIAYPTIGPVDPVARLPLNVEVISS
ncbi:hypothetical protein IEO21_04768 [Rhodonia placenta]|uniref:Cytochrome P450 n=1 Tax=Rhodonia placenta TaxID=104341 RepID=A0A8H7U2Q9_9APHY|nr:hypothetical protein IEO21_04768 [Postia placenta]